MKSFSCILFPAFLAQHCVCKIHPHCRLKLELILFLCCENFFVWIAHTNLVILLLMNIWVVHWTSINMDTWLLSLTSNLLLFKYYLSFYLFLGLQSFPMLFSLFHSLNPFLNSNFRLSNVYIAFMVFIKFCIYKCFCNF